MRKQSIQDRVSASILAIRGDCGRKARNPSGRNRFGAREQNGQGRGESPHDALPLAPAGKTPKKQPERWQERELRLDGGQGKQDSGGEETAPRQQSSGNGEQRGHQQRELLQLKALDHRQARQGKNRDQKRATAASAQMEKGNPKGDADDGQQEKHDGRNCLRGGEGESESGEQKECHIDGVGETLLVMGIEGRRRIKGSSVIAGLNFAGDLWPIGVTMIEDKFASADPAGIEVGENAARAGVSDRVLLLVGDEDALHVIERACAQ